MFRQMLRSKIHRATVTESCLDYEGSLTIDEDLMDAAGILPYEAIVCSNLNNGERFMTYAVAGKRGAGEIILNGPTARKGANGSPTLRPTLPRMSRIPAAGTNEASNPRKSAVSACQPSHAPRKAVSFTSPIPIPAG